ncbi:Protein transport protein S9 plasma membrane t-SNARE [Puccinia graminis f. sp. tritici]|uniref:Protein transport protein S9 plasma membrane t-SNARE n=1 Tax=Puccinia graminis f. sp. tritici TaxID=56615 RepID=A0A5B0N4M9_PUCGR|nr:Protein transport protein S9 plasma membrane t-SNARE [Puccinia graminis f. sp. tritici]KAA1093951.1 Protein transport protein S9 plasma membrane t-SNARE [Puccinia graminis f. sp. tritici]
MFSRKKAVEIPPVEESQGPSAPPVNRNLLSSSRSPAGPSSSGRPMANDRFGNPDPNRQELFKGARPPNRSFVDRGMDGPPGSSGNQLDDEDEEVEAIKQQIKFAKQESLSSTRNAARIAREAEETARNTMNRLGEQSDRLANTENHLDLAKAHAVRADDQQKEIVALNRSIFRPTFTFNKKGKQYAHEQKLLSRHEEEKVEREEVRRQPYESRQRTAETLKALDKGVQINRKEHPEDYGLDWPIRLGANSRTPKVTTSWRMSWTTTSTRCLA